MLKMLIELLVMVVSFVVDLVYGKEDIEFNGKVNHLDYWKYRCDESAKWFKEYVKLKNIMDDVYSICDDDDIEAFEQRLKYVEDMVKFYGVIDI